MSHQYSVVTHDFFSAFNISVSVGLAPLTGYEIAVAGNNDPHDNEALISALQILSVGYKDTRLGSEFSDMVMRSAPKKRMRERTGRHVRIVELYRTKLTAGNRNGVHTHTSVDDFREIQGIETEIHPDTMLKWESGDAYLYLAVVYRGDKKGRTLLEKFKDGYTDLECLSAMEY